MSRLVWDETGERFYETGIRHGVLYPIGSGEESGTYPVGVEWNGLTAFTEAPSGAEPNPIYADDMKYLNLMSVEEFGGTLEAYYSPEEFDECDGTKEIAPGVTIGQQIRRMFGLCYRTVIGNDELLDELGYKLHLIYGALASPSERNYTSVNDSPEAASLSWEITTTPVPVANTKLKPTSRLVIDSTRCNAECLKNLEDILYGVDAEAFSASKSYAVGDYCIHTDDDTANTYKCKAAIETPGEWDASKWDLIEKPGPRLPLPDEVFEIMTPKTNA